MNNILYKKDRTMTLINERISYLRDVEHVAKKIIDSGTTNVDNAIQIIGLIISLQTANETIIALEKLIEVLNDGPYIRKINELSEEQSKYAANILSAVYDCVTMYA